MNEKQENMRAITVRLDRAEAQALVWGFEWLHEIPSGPLNESQTNMLHSLQSSLNLRDVDDFMCVLTQRGLENAQLAMSASGALAKENWGLLVANSVITSLCLKLTKALENIHDDVPETDPD